MGTSNSDKPMCTKLLLDCTRKWCRTAKSVQTYKDHAENKIYPHWWWTKSTGKTMVQVTQSFTSQLFPITKMSGQNLRKLQFQQWATTTAHIRSSRIWKFFRKQGGKPDCRIIVHKWYYTRTKCIWCTKYTSAPMQVNKRELWKASQQIQWLLFVKTLS